MKTTEKHGQAQTGTDGHPAPAKVLIEIDRVGWRTRVIGERGEVMSDRAWELTPHGAKGVGPGSVLDDLPNNDADSDPEEEYSQLAVWIDDMTGTCSDIAIEIRKGAA